MSGITILVDQDGPLADFDARFYQHCADSRFPMHGGDVHAGALCVEHRFATDCLEHVHAKAARQHVNQTHWFSELPVVDGAVDGINALADHPDVEAVWICTKPLEANPHCQSDKANWVRKHLGEDWLRRLIITPDKSMVRGDILLDDAPKPEWFPIAEWAPVVFPMSWNATGSRWSSKADVDTAPRWTWGDPIDELVDIAVHPLLRGQYGLQPR